MARTMEVDKISGGGKSSGQRQVKVSARTLTDQHVQVRPRTPPKMQQVQVDVRWRRFLSRYDVTAVNYGSSRNVHETIPLLVAWNTEV
ncbi:hypothetical protein F442_10747 [Phytophthora nicotianae P10297]|uniref:Uncharacterized protein n=1 Tax=Phytophthora nicotianae P10297 TaxID=1317064 RepID=W2Z5J6_PHYNI|nr:hypothetical protein F442_10747 [Phytophthora nicotianae P10297]